MSKTTRLARATAWLLVLFAAVLTLGPQSFRPVTGIGHDPEHVLAFALIGLAFGLGYSNHRILLAVLAIAVAALMEILQQWVPGRHAYVLDFVINALGACLGLGATALWDLLKWTAGARGASDREV